MNIKCIALDLDRTTLNASGRSFDTLPKDVLAVPGIEYDFFYSRTY